ncbi:hypothetical protein C0993_009384, partial [Termitomyces sp. T159_Od127]
MDAHMRPLDALLWDHFQQGVLRNMKGTGAGTGAGEPSWDFEDALGNGHVDLLRADVWGGEEGWAHLEFELAHRFHVVVVEQEGEGEGEGDVL